MTDIFAGVDSQAGPSTTRQSRQDASSASPGLEDGITNTSGGDGQKKRRTRNGCLVCRKRKKLCDEQKPSCGACTRLLLTCEWEDKMQAALERRRKRIERLQQKERIKQEEEEKSRELQANAGAAGTPDSMMAVAAWPYGAAGMGWPPTMIPSWPSTGVDFGIPPYNPATPSIVPQPPTFSASPSAPPVSTAWMPFLGSFAPTPYEPAATNEPMGWSATLPPHVGAFSPQAGPAPAILPQSASSGQADDERQSEQLDVDHKSTGSSPPFDLFALLRSPSPGAHPFSAALNQPMLDNLALPGSNEALSSLDLQMVATKAVDADRLALAAFSDAVAQAQVTPHPDQPLPVAVNQAASFLASADFAFTQSYLLSHYTTSLARLVSLASAPSSESSSSRPSSSSEPKSARASANLYLSLVPLAHRHTFLLHAILSWSAANLAAASAARQQGAEAPVPGQPPAGGGNSVMASLSDQLGHLADQGLVAALPALEAYAAARAERAADQSMSDETRREKDLEEIPQIWEAMLAARLMLTHTAICQGAVDLWRTRMREAAQIINLVGGVRQCRSPLARQLVKNLLYHDVLSSSSRNDGLLVDYSALRTRDSARDGGSAKTSPASATPGEGDSEQDRLDEEDEEDVLDTLMGAAEAVFLLIACITNLAKEKRQALKTSGGTIAEDDLSTYMRKVEEIKYELEREKDRMDAFLVERPDLEPHRYFHEVFRLAALLYLEMLLELPPTSYPILLLVRKMLSLTEVIVSESLPGLCSMHWPLFLMHLNSTPLVSPHSSLTDRARSTRLFDRHMDEFTFMNTKRSRALIDEAWRRSEDGRKFVDPDSILEEWGWHLNWA
ncbi:hypothetical protein NBRC10512v2_003633 [Rhodotorula toruloides]